MIEVTTNTAAFDSALQQLQRRLGSLSKPMQEIGAALETAIGNRRETGTDPNGRRWAAWSASYAASYHIKRKGETGAPRGRVLERTGDMWEGLVSNATDDSVRVGFGQTYASFHEVGVPSRNMPRRGLLFADADAGTLSRDDEGKVLDILEEWLSGALL